MILLLATALAADRVEGADTLAVGSTAVANPYGMGGIAANPAIIGLEERYQFGGGFSYGGRGIHWQAGAIDSLTSAAAFGLTYSGDLYNPPLTEEELPGWAVPGVELTNHKRTHDLGFALGAPFFENRFVVGLGGSLAFYNHERSGKGTTGNMSAGLAYRPDPHVAIGLSGRNLLPVRAGASDRPMELLGGLWLGENGVAALSLEGGARPESSKPLLLASGIEVNASEAAAMRAGWRLQDGVHNLALGAGGGTTDGSVDIGIVAPANRLTKPLDWTFMLSLRFKGPDIDSITPDDRR
ncbi:MAG: hypothetical protein R3F61_27325 [Myxococcota bacterium]